jgi:hypothetical protein
MIRLRRAPSARHTPISRERCDPPASNRLARFIAVKKNRRTFGERHIGAFFIGPFANHAVSCVSNVGIETQKAGPSAYNT